MSQQDFNLNELNNLTKNMLGGVDDMLKGVTRSVDSAIDSLPDNQKMSFAQEFKKANIDKSLMDVANQHAEMVKAFKE